MTSVRRVLRGMVLAWLCCQVGTTALAPAVIWLGATSARIECRCAHEDHSICPMHHPPAPGSRDCVIVSTRNDDAAVLTGVLGSVGLTADSASAPQRDHHGIVVRAMIESPVPNTSPPDPPPPRV